MVDVSVELNRSGSDEEDIYQCDEDDNEDDKDRTLSFHDYDDMMNTDSVGGDGDDGVDDDDDEGNPVLWFPAIACRPFAKLLSHQATGGMRIICIVMIPILITPFMSLMMLRMMLKMIRMGTNHLLMCIEYIHSFGVFLSHLKRLSNINTHSQILSLSFAALKTHFFSLPNTFVPTFFREFACLSFFPRLDTL